MSAFPETPVVDAGRDIEGPTRSDHRDAILSTPSSAEPDADQIKKEHRLALKHRNDAVRHAITCGTLLLARKKSFTYGLFMPWVTRVCGIPYSTAARYMKAAHQSSTGVEISSLSQLFPSGRSHKAARANAFDGTAPRREVAPAAAQGSGDAVADDAVPTLVSGTSVEERVEHSLRTEEAPAADSVETSTSVDCAAVSIVPGLGRDADLRQIKTAIAEYAGRYGWGAAAFDLVAWIEEQYAPGSRS